MGIQTLLLIKERKKEKYICCFVIKRAKKHKKEKLYTYSRDVSTGATGAIAVAPKFSDTLTLFQPGGGRFCPPLARSHLNFSCGYVPDRSANIWSAMAHPAHPAGSNRPELYAFTAVKSFRVNT
jgi:hypothetical protein